MAAEPGQLIRNESPVVRAPADAPVAIVSAFGRGNWLALELARQGFRVTLIDVTESLGEIAPEDAEGPFGLFEASDVPESLKTRLASEGELLEVAGGFALWLSDGPVELRSAFVPARLKALGLSDASVQYVSNSRAPDKEAERALREIARAPFKSTWLAHFAHQLFSLRHEESHRALELGHVAPIGARFSIRQATREGWSKGLDALRAAGVTVRQNASVRDLRLNGRDVDAIEVDDDHSGIERARAFVWLVSTNESKRLEKKLFETLFPGGAVEPEWYWQRHRLKLGGERPAEELPRFVAVVDDVFLPWTNGNVLILRKRKEPRSFDVWQKVPVAVLGDAPRLAQLAADAQARLARRMPQFEPVIEAALPAPGLPTLHGIYADEALGDLDILRSGNFFFCGPEHYEMLDWLGAYRAQNVVLAKLVKLKSQWDAAAAKLAAKEAAR